MRTASLLIVVLALKSSWEPSSAASIDISNSLAGGNAMGGSGHGTSSAMTGGNAGPGSWGGNGGQGGWGGYGGQGPWNGHCGPNGCGVPQTPSGCKSPSGCKPGAYSRTVVDESTDSAGVSELKNQSSIYIRVPVYIYVPTEMQAFVDKQRIARSFTENLIPNLTQNSEGTSEKRTTRNFIESVATSVSGDNPTSAIKDTQRFAQNAGKGRLPRGTEGQLNEYLNYEAQDEVTNRVVKQLTL